ncbi:major facilitator superfamily domain-containing protein [Phakopsora pachyrhizi]|uniref:Major facilitator superfamily domain-containing protein n=1 Tax=Phakopsora pachyrhizi TaxID=170000 RepID=A0AAV0BGJ3_PHAPC|nr:major facilitator superfamily domain-containing protein [Phakopsora pachyrhizi]
MDGIGNIPGWGWIFIVEGIFTTICGIGGFFVFPLSPSQCQFLTLEERDIMKLRLEKDSFDTISSKEENFSWKQILQAFKSPHVILVSAALFMTGVNIYGLAYFQPSIIRSLGFKGKMIQLISVPPFAVGFISMISTSYASDRYRSRGVTATLCSAVAFIGYALFYTQSSNSVRYGSIFLSTAGVYSVSPTLYAWIANNSMPHYRKATAIALGPVAANSGGILSTWLFPTSAEPQYRLATIINMSFSAGT